MKKKLMCKKDWEMSGVVHFEKGKEYEGTLKENYVRKGITTFVVKNKNGGRMNFHTGSDYFDI